MKSFHRSLRSAKRILHSKRHALVAIIVVVSAASALFVSGHASALYNQNVVQDGGYNGTDYGVIPRTRINAETRPPSSEGTDVPVTAEFTNGGGGTAGRDSFTTALNVTLWYPWNRALGGLFPSSDTTMNGWVAALSNPSVTIGYDYGVYDAANPTQMIQKGATVSQGQQIILKFKPYVSDNIFWFGTGYSMDSPYGEWRTNAAAPPRVANKVTCEDKDLTAKFTTGSLAFDVYIPFVVDPPARTIANTSGLTCGAVSQNGDGSVSSLCTVTGSGSVSPTFNYANTYGKFYYRYYDYRDMTNIGWGVAGCYGNNIPMTSNFGAATGPTTNGNTLQQSAYSVAIPQQSFSYPLNVGATTNTPPGTPAISCTATAQVGQDVSVTLTATDPQNDQLQYGVDWIDDGNLQVNSGWTSSVPSGTAQTLTKTGGFSTAGTYSIYGWARDPSLAQSATPASCTITVTTPNTPPNLTADAAPNITVTAGNAATLIVNARNNGGTSTGAPFPAMMLRSDTIGGPYTIVRLFKNGSALGIPAGYPANYSEPVSATFTPVNTTTYYRLCVDADDNWAGSITESNETDNCGAYGTITAIPPADLTADNAPNITGTPGNPVTLSAMVKNIGGGPTQVPFPAMILRSDTIGGPETIVRLFKGPSAFGIPNGFPGNYGEVATASFVPVNTTSYYRLCADVDDTWTGSVAESNETNNCGGYGTITVAAAAQPDLTAGPTSAVSGTAGQSVTLSTTVTNIGAGPTGAPFTDTFFIDDDQDTSNGVIAAPTFPSGIPNGFPPTYGESTQITHTFASPGTYFYRVCADNNPSYVGSIAESDEGNNCGAWTSITITPAAAAAVSCTVSPSSISPGGTANYSAAPSGAATGPYTWLDSDGWTTTTAGLSTSRTYATAGTYAMQVKASNTGYAYCSTPLTVGGGTTCAGPANLTITAAPDRVRSGNTTVIAWTGNNVGGAAAACTITGPGLSQTIPAGAVPTCTIPSNTATVTITAQSTYTISCTDGSRKSVTVNVIPEFTEF